MNLDPRPPGPMTFSGCCSFRAASAKSQSSHTVCKVGLGYIELKLSCLLISRDVGEHFLADEARVYGDALRNGPEALLVIARTARDCSREINRERRLLEHDADVDG